MYQRMVGASNISGDHEYYTQYYTADSVMGASYVYAMPKKKTSLGRSREWLRRVNPVRIMNTIHNITLLIHLWVFYICVCA